MKIHHFETTVTIKVKGKISLESTTADDEVPGMIAEEVTEIFNELDLSEGNGDTLEVTNFDVDCKAATITNVEDQVDDEAAA